MAPVTPTRISPCCFASQSQASLEQTQGTTDPALVEVDPAPAPVDQLEPAEAAPQQVVLHPPPLPEGAQAADEVTPVEDTGPAIEDPDADRDVLAARGEALEQELAQGGFIGTIGPGYNRETSAPTIDVTTSDPMTAEQAKPISDAIIGSGLTRDASNIQYLSHPPATDLAAGFDPSQTRPAPYNPAAPNAVAPGTPGDQIQSGDVHTVMYADHDAMWDQEAAALPDLPPDMAWRDSQGSLVEVTEGHPTEQGSFWQQQYEAVKLEEGTVWGPTADAQFLPPAPQDHYWSRQTDHYYPSATPQYDYELKKVLPYEEPSSGPR